ncbi:MAG TPA: XRE family transcriptional regulator [Solirubrobacterales bacterium]|jgi:DNA-binding XRE family transcriptional regulator|nr:XRE family transcriptional regulator [Solirubrobacterales bacterium]
MARRKNREFQELSDEVRKQPGAHEEIEARKAGLRAGLRLGELRQRRNQTQVNLAQALNTSQANVSRMERTGNPYLETLADYVDALGGRLEITAVFEDEVVPLSVLVS